MDLAQLRRELSAGKHRPCYCLYGPETFLMEEALSILVEALLPPEERELGVVRLYADECSVEEVLNEARTLPFFSQQRLVVVRRVEAWEGLFTPRRKAAPLEGGEIEQEETGEGRLDAHRQHLLDYLANPNATTNLIFIARQIDGRLPVVRELKALGSMVECTTLSEVAAARWVRERAGALGCELSREDAALLVEHVGPDLQRLSQELEKLAEYISQDGGDTTEAIERLVAGGRERSAFELTGAIARQDTETALRRLEALLTIGEGEGPLHPLQVLGSLAGQVRRVWLVKDSAQKGLPDRETYNRAFKTPAKRMSTWHQDRLRELRETSERFSEADLARVLRRLLQADSELKGEGTSERRTLEALVIDLCGAG